MEATTTTTTTTTSVTNTKLLNGGRRLVLLPLPFQGHINPMLQLANILHSKGFSITILHTQFNSPNPVNYPHFNFIPISGSSKLNHSVSDVGNIICFLQYLNNNLMVPIRECLEWLMSEDDGVTCLVTDAIWYATQRVADQLKIPRIVHRTSSVSSFLATTAFPILRDTGYFRHFSDEGFLSSLNSYFLECL